MTLNEYAKKILADHNCDIYTYGGEFSKYVLDDLKEEYPDGMEYPYVDVANAILEMSRPEPIKRAKWQMVWDTDSCCDGCYFDTFEAAKASAEDTLIEWEMEEVQGWTGYDPTDEQIDSWNYMIYNCSVEVRKYNPDTDEYEEYWYPSYEDVKNLGWVTWDEYKKLLREGGIIE